MSKTWTSLWELPASLEAGFFTSGPPLSRHFERCRKTGVDLIRAFLAGNQWTNAHEKVHDHFTGDCEMIYPGYFDLTLTRNEWSMAIMTLTPVMDACRAEIGRLRAEVTPLDLKIAERRLVFVENELRYQLMVGLFHHVAEGIETAEVVGENDVTLAGPWNVLLTAIDAYLTEAAAAGLDYQVPQIAELHGKLTELLHDRLAASTGWASVLH